MTALSRGKKNVATLPCGRPLPQTSYAAVAAQNATDAWKEKLQSHLAKAGLKQSEQRTKIVDLIISQQRHFTTQDMVRRVQTKFPGIGAATVYRNISLLLEAKILKETLIGDGRESVYELYDGEHHDHIVCLDCGQIFEFHEEAIEELQEKVTEKMGFQASRHRHVIYGHCDYRKTERGSKR